MKRYDQITWTWFLARARVHDGHGWQDLAPGLRDHLQSCGLADDCEPLQLGEVGEFADTESPGNQIEAVIAGRWDCACGMYGHRDNWRLIMGIKDPPPLGEILREVLEISDRWEAADPAA